MYHSTDFPELPAIALLSALRDGGGQKGTAERRWRHRRSASPTWFYFHHHGLSVLIPHLSDVQQIMRVAVVPRPTIDKDPRATAPTVHHDPVVHIGVVGVCGFNVGHSGQVSGVAKHMRLYWDEMLSCAWMTEKLQSTNASWDFQALSEDWYGSPTTAREGEETGELMLMNKPTLITPGQKVAQAPKSKLSPNCKV